jgi:O-antigen/teichoic acid export membrane protein
MISKHFFKSSLIYSIVGTLPVASGIIIMPLFMKYLTPTDFGVNALYLTIVYFAQVLSTYGLDSYIGISYFDYKNNSQKLKEHVRTILVSLIVIGAFIISIMSVFGSQLFRLIFHDQFISFYPFGLMSVATGIFNGFLKTYSGLLINQQRPVRFFWVNIINFSLVIGVSILFLRLYPNTLNGPMLGRLLPAAFSFFVVSYYMIREFGFGFKKEFIKGMISFCNPMVVYAIFIWIISYIDRFIIEHFMVDPMYVGIFDVGVKLTMLIDFLQIGLANTIHPKVYNTWKDHNLNKSTPEVNRYYNGFTAITIIIIPVFLIVIPFLVPIIVHKEIYFQCFPYLALLCLGFATRPMYYMLLAPIFYFKKTKVLPKVFFFAAIFQITLSYFLVKEFGLIGAVWANFLIKPIQLIIVYYESRKIFNFEFNFIKQLYFPLFYIILVIICEQIIRIFGVNRYAIYTGELLVIFTITYYLYRNEIKLVLGNIINRKK